MKSQFFRNKGIIKYFFITLLFTILINNQSFGQTVESVLLNDSSSAITVNGGDTVKVTVNTRVTSWFLGSFSIKLELVNKNAPYNRVEFACNTVSNIYFSGTYSTDISITIPNGYITTWDLVANVYRGSSCSGSASQRTLMNAIKVEKSTHIFSGTNLKSFELLYSNNTKGDIAIFGNAIRGKWQNGRTICANDNDNNADTSQSYWDIDSTSETYSSSSAILDLPSNSKIIKAYLFWQGLANRNDFATASSIKLKTPDSANYVNLEAEYSSVNWLNPYSNMDFFAYQAYVDVTDLIKDSGNYIVGNLYTLINTSNRNDRYGGLGTYGAWSIVVAYENKDESLKNLSIFSGYQSISNGNDKVISLSGFLTPLSGNIDSKLIVFAGEGDVDIGGDQIFLNNKVLRRNLSLSESKDSTRNNAFDAAVTSNGEYVTNRNPNCQNNLGIDIHTYDVGSSGLNIMKNGDKSAQIKLTSSQDTYFPSVVAFSTALYEPRVCYYIDTILEKNSQKVVFQNATFIDSLKPNTSYQFNIWFSNMKKSVDDIDLETAQLVQSYFHFKIPLELSYIKSSTYIKNIGSSSNLLISDGYDSDIGEYDEASNTSIWRIGTGANSVNGGSISPASYFEDNSKKAFVSFDALLSGTSSEQIDLNDWFDIKASFKTDLVTIERENAQSIDQCKNFNTNADVMSIVGNFTVVNENFNSNTLINEDSRDENKLYTQVAGKEFKVKVLALKPTSSSNRFNLEDVQGNVTVEVIESPDYSSCKNNSNEDICKITICSNAKSIDSSFYGGLFKSDSGSSGKMTIKNKINESNKKLSFRVKHSENKDSASCSLDSFSVRPATFSINSDLDFIGGKESIFNTSALDYDLRKISNGYKTNTDDIAVKNILLDKNATCEKEINLTELDIKIGSFNDGKSNNSKVFYNNIGDINMTITDDTWTLLDQFKKDVECFSNSSSNEHKDGRVGCNVEKNITISFVPNSFTNTLRLRNYNNDSNTYISSNNDMSEHIIVDIAATL
ncbi:MAG: hypothetical protein ACK5LP_05575 [Campylobacteraceae bacterium]